MATRIIAVLNQKGGVGKTTTCVNLGAALARRGKRVLLIDMDPQANLTVHFGFEPPRLPRTTYSLLLSQHGLAEAVQQTGVPGLVVVPSTLALANAEIQLASTVGRELVLREALEAWLHPGAAPDEQPFAGIVLGGTSPTPTPTPVSHESLDEGGEPTSGSQTGAPSGPTADFVLIDCPPSLGTLTMNALCAAGEVLLPIQTEFFALQGVAGILESIKAVQRLNRSLRLSMVVPSMVDRRTTLARDVIDEVRAYFPKLTTRTEIRKNVKLAEAPSHGKTIFEWDPRCNGAKDYDALAAEVLGDPDDEPDAVSPPAKEEAAKPEPPQSVAPQPEASESGAPEAAGDKGTNEAEPRDGAFDAVDGDDGTPDSGTPDEPAREVEPRPASGISLPAEYGDAPAEPTTTIQAEPETASEHPEPAVSPAVSRTTPAEPAREEPRFDASLSESTAESTAQSDLRDRLATQRPAEPTASRTEPPALRSEPAPPRQATPAQRHPDHLTGGSQAPERPWWRAFRRS